MANTFQATCDTESLKASIGRIDKFIKRDQALVSLVAGKPPGQGRGRSAKRKLWIEGHGDFGHMQLALQASNVKTAGDTRGITMEQKTLQQIARGVGDVELAADGDAVKFRRYGTLGTLTGRFDTLPFDGRTTNPRGDVENETEVKVDQDQAAAMEKYLRHVSIHNAVAKDKEMEIWLDMTDKGSRLLVFDNWHAACVVMKNVKSDEPVSVHVDRDLFAAVASMPGKGWTMRIGSDVVRVHNSEFAVRSSIVDEYTGRTGKDMLGIFSASRKAAAKDGTPSMTMASKAVKELVKELGMAGARSDAIELVMKKRNVLNWSCRTENGRVSVDQNAKNYNAQGDWPDKEPVKLSPGLLADVVDVMPDDAGIDISVVGDSCMMRADLEGAFVNYLMLLS